VTPGAPGRARKRISYPSSTKSANLVKKRIKLIIIFIFSALIVSWFFGMSGEGTGAPIAVFGSWGLVIAFLVMKSALGIILFCLLYFFCLFILDTFLSRKIRRDDPLIPALIHGAGSLIAARMVGHGSHFTTFFLISAYMISIVLTMIYLTLDWRMARAVDGDK
jgi:hypothetical protein